MSGGPCHPCRTQKRIPGTGQPPQQPAVLVVGGFSPRYRMSRTAIVGLAEVGRMGGRGTLGDGGAIGDEQRER